MNIEDREHYFMHVIFKGLYSDLISQKGNEDIVLTRDELESKLLDTFNKYTYDLANGEELKGIEEMRNLFFEENRLDRFIALKVKTKYLSLCDDRYSLTDKGATLIFENMWNKD